MVETSTKILKHREVTLSAFGFLVALALVVFAFASTSAAQEAGRRATPSLTSEDLLDRPTYNPVPSPARISSPSTSSSSRTIPVGGLYRDPSGAFTLSLPSGSWQLDKKSQGKGRPSDLRVFRKLDADGFASATASVFVLSQAANLSVRRADAAGQRAIADALVARFLSTSAAIVSADVSNNGFQVVADQLISRRAVVRALICAFEHDGHLYVVVCRAPVESFDQEAREFSAITQSLASSVARSS